MVIRRPANHDPEWHYSILDLVCKKYFADQMLKDPNTLFDPVILGSDNPQCKIPEVQRNVASFMLAMTLVVGLLSAVVAPKLGHLSDRHGRRRLMAIASCGGLVAECITILAAKFPQTVDYRWLIVGSVFDGITGSFTAGSILSQSYTSDCTHPSKRAVSMGYLHACLFGGLAFGPLISGYFVKWTGSLVSIFYVALGCHIFFIVFVALIIPESLSKRKQQLAQVKWEREKEQRADSGSWFSTLQNSNPLASLKILWPTGKGTSSRLRFNLIALAIADTIILGTAMAVGPVLILYSGYMFNWGNFETSRFVSALSMTRVFVLLVIFPIINYFGRTRPAAQQLRDSGVPRKNVGADNLDIWILRVAMFSDVLGSVGYILSRSETLFVGSGMLTALGGLGSATVQAVVTKHIPPERVGQVVGAIGMLHALTRVVGPVLFNSLYAMTVGTFPQAFLVLLSALYGVGLVCTFFIKPNGKHIAGVL